MSALEKSCIEQRWSLSGQISKRYRCTATSEQCPNYPGRVCGAASVAMQKQQRDSGCCRRAAPRGSNIISPCYCSRARPHSPKREPLGRRGKRCAGSLCKETDGREQERERDEERSAKSNFCHSSSPRAKCMRANMPIVRCPLSLL